jgi:hypothetical protein
MIVRKSFISNSSSTSFIITNKGPGTKTLRQFVIENIDLVERFNEAYDGSYTEEQAIRSTESHPEYEKLEPGENIVIFGDEDGTVIGHIYDYILREGGESRSFKWRFKEWQR